MPISLLRRFTVLTMSRLFRQPAVLFGSWLFLSCQAQAASQDDWLIVPGVRVGPITAGTAPTKLAEMFGEANVQPGEIQRQEGPPRIGTVVYRDEPARRLEIIWQELEIDRFLGAFSSVATRAPGRPRAVSL